MGRIFPYDALLWVKVTENTEEVLLGLRTDGSWNLAPRSEWRKMLSVGARSGEPYVWDGTDSEVSQLCRNAFAVRRVYDLDYAKYRHARWMRDGDVVAGEFASGDVFFSEVRSCSIRLDPVTCREYRVFKYREPKDGDWEWGKLPIEP